MGRFVGVGVAWPESWRHARLALLLRPSIAAVSRRIHCLPSIPTRCRWLVPPMRLYIVTVLFDYKCPHCQQLHFMLDEAIRRYGGKLAFALVRRR